MTALEDAGIAYAVAGGNAVAAWVSRVDEAAVRIVERLHDIYRALTLLPSARKDYSLQEFARDVYPLDGSGHRTSKGGLGYRLHPGATGAKNRPNLLVVVTREGAEQTACGGCCATIGGIVCCRESS
ncbi:MAG: hypothetical protein HY319_13310 [Armatimonadetes bacterium]|nr:hypothetical protein [Armatimonadota bacterium]